MPRHVRLLGLAEKIVYIYNPLPAGITERQLLDEADLKRAVGNKTADVFAMHWQHSAGLECEHIDIVPQEAWQLREPEAKLCLAELGELGLCVVSDINDRIEVLEKSVDALRKAEKFYRDRGEKGVLNFAKVQGLSMDDTLKMYKYDLWIYFVNERKAHHIAEELDRVEEQLEALHEAAKEDKAVEAVDKPAKKAS